MKILLLTLLATMPIFEVTDFEVYDADTYTVGYQITPGACSTCGTFSRTRVRLAGFDSWETTRRKGITEGEVERGKEAREFVKQLATSATKITVQPLRIEKYGRTLSNVYIDGKQLSQILWENCHGTSYDGSVRGDVYLGCTNPKTKEVSSADD